MCKSVSETHGFGVYAKVKIPCKTDNICRYFHAQSFFYELFTSGLHPKEQRYD